MAVPKAGSSTRVVHRLWGVKGVSNLITIKPLASPTDMRKKIEEALVRSAQHDAERITVEVQGTKVILKVRSWADRQEAERTPCWLRGPPLVKTKSLFFSASRLRPTKHNYTR